MLKLCCLAIFVALSAGCSAVEPLLLRDPTINLVWPSPPDNPRIRYLRDIKGPEDIFPAKTRIQEFSELLTGDSRQMLELMTPYSVTTDDHDLLFIADPTAGVVHRYDLKAREVAYIVRAGDELLQSPVAVALDSEGNLFVSDSQLAKVFKYSSSGEFKQEVVPPGGFRRPAGIAISPTGEMFVVDVLANKLLKFNRNLVFVSDFPAILEGEELNTPSHVAIGKDGKVYVTDAMNFYVRVYDPNGHQVRRIGGIGDVPGTFARPKGLALDSEQNIYIVDATHDNFQVFNQEGQLLIFVGNSGDGAGGFYLPSGIHIDRFNRVFIADTFNRRIQLFQLLNTGGKHE
jgi:sugar lactone lactonase YvrE